MKARAAVAWEPRKPLEIEEVEVAGPKQGEVLLKVHATGVCHTDAFTLSGEDPEGAFPAILGHEGGCEVLECGPGVKSRPSRTFPRFSGPREVCVASDIRRPPRVWHRYQPAVPP